MMRLFGGFGPDCYAAYADAYPLAPRLGGPGRAASDRAARRARDQVPRPLHRRGHKRDPALCVRLIQEPAGMTTVDVAEERRADVVAEELLHPGRESRDDHGRHREDVVLDRAQPGDAVVQHDAEPRTIRCGWHHRRARGCRGRSAPTRRASRSESSAGQAPGVSSIQRWLPATIRVAPFASVKSSSGHMTFTTSSGCGRGSG